ncbi:hypothetical protein M3223_00180 [Paenibacillus pasadenensis]|uniref:hypothetical protein n=1 Tax=Paenibacillus pasadenensis TaxID=217090 RepID=UPI00203EB237|nr:hypothetical protein [Paenibacillus pasadenensis]MCM3745758.1 hypothetical protein [Paenibacillus pasadenensis]
MRPGFILVLFILLVIVTSVFGKSSGEGNTNIAPQASRRFDIINQANYPSFTLVSTNLYGDFESPPPAPHEIGPESTYSFQVKRDYFYITEAFATYNVVTRFREVIGSFEIKMRLNTHVPSTTIVSKVGSDFTLDNGNTYVYVRNFIPET